MTSPMILSRHQWTMLDKMKSMMWTGRKKATTGGGLVSDLVALKKCIILCGTCQHKFDWRRHQYYSVWKYEHEPVIGECDVCCTPITGDDGRFFIHEAVRKDSWVTKDELKDRRKTMVRTAMAYKGR